MSNNNGNFVKVIFWTLIIGSFSWATVVGAAAFAKVEAVCRDAAEERERIRVAMIARDEQLVKEMTSEFKTIAATLAEVSTDLKYIKRELKTD